MRTSFRPRRAVSAAIVAGILCTLGTTLALGASAAASERISEAPAAVRADAEVPAAPDPTNPPDPLPTADPDPSTTPDPDPEPTSAPTTPADPVPTADPVPADVPASPSEAPVAPAPEPSVSDTPPVEPTNDSSDSDDSDDPVIEESPTPTPVETATVAPAPVITQTAAPAPAIELPFYPPPSSGAARDAFPFAIAGIIGALVLLLGVATYLFTRWRLRRLRYSPATRLGGLVFSGTQGGAGYAAHLLTSGTATGSLALPWLGARRPQKKAAGADGALFDLALPAPVASDAAPQSSDLLDLGFGDHNPATERELAQSDFALGLTPSERETTAARQPDTADSLHVFPTPETRPPEPSSVVGRFRLSLGTRPPAAGSGTFDLGLPATS